MLHFNMLYMDFWQNNIIVIRFVRRHYLKKQSKYALFRENWGFFEVWAAIYDGIFPFILVEFFVVGHWI